MIATGKVAGRVEYGRKNLVLLVTTVRIVYVETHKSGVQRARNGANSENDTHCSPWSDISHCYLQIPYQNRYPVQTLWFQCSQNCLGLQSFNFEHI